MTQSNLMYYIPVRQADWDNDESDRVVLYSPKSRYTWIRSLIKRFNIDPYYKIHLDEYGSYLWKIIDGRQSVYQLCNQLKARFGNQVEPVYERGGLLIKAMASNNFIIYQTA